MKPSLVASSRRERPALLRNHVGAQDARLQRGQKRRVLGQDAFLAFRRHRDHQLGVAFENDLRGRDELERHYARHGSSVPAFSLTCSIVPA